MGEWVTSAWILCVYTQGAIVLSAIIINFVEESAIGGLWHRPDPSEIVGKVGDNQVFSRWEIGPVAVVAGIISCCGESDLGGECYAMCSRGFVRRPSSFRPMGRLWP